MQVGVLVTSNSTKVLNNFGVHCSPKGRELSRYIAFSHSIARRCLSAGSTGSNRNAFLVSIFASSVCGLVVIIYGLWHHPRTNGTELPFPYITWMISWLWATLLPNLQSKLANFYRSMWNTWGTFSSRKSRGTFHQLNFLGNYPRHQLNGNSFCKWEASAHSQWNPELATKEECHKGGDSFPSWPSAACHQSGEMWLYFIGWMYQSTAKVKELSFYTRLTKIFRSDLYWWYFF